MTTKTAHARVAIRLLPNPGVARRSATLVLPASIALIAVAGGALLSGCEGCATRSARAQDDGGDGGAPPAPAEERIVVVPVPIPASPEPEPQAPATCYERAFDRTSLVDTQIVALCSGAWNAGPADCYLAARRRLSITDPQRVALCRCASSDAPVDCHRHMQRETFLTDLEILELCAPVSALGLLPNCRPLGA